MALADESLERFRRSRWNWGIARALSVSAALALKRGVSRDATGAWQEAVDRFRAAGERRYLSACLEGLATVAERDERTDRALRLRTAAVAVHGSLDSATIEASEPPLPLRARLSALPGGAWSLDAIAQLVHEP
jgi:hypothetical protein